MAICFFQKQKIIYFEYKIPKNFKPLASVCVELVTLRTDYALISYPRVRNEVETEINLNVSKCKRMCPL